MSKISTATGGYDKEDNDFVKDINKIDDAIANKYYEGGKRIQEYVDKRGGIKHGDKTITTIGTHPDIQVSTRTLRRWWDYYRIFSEMSTEIEQVCPNINACNMYELSRILTAPVATKAGETQDAACRRKILELSDWLSRKRKTGGISSNDFAIMVTKAIDDNLASDFITLETSPEVKPKKKKRSSIGKRIAFTDPEDAVDFLESFSSPEHLAKASINKTELSAEVNRLADSLVRLADHLATHGYVDHVRALVGSLRTQLAEIEAKLDTAKAA